MVADTTDLQSTAKALVGAFEQVVVRLFSYDGGLFWPYVLGFVAVATIVWLRTPRHSGRSLQSLVTFLFPRSVYGTRSAQLDLRFFVVNFLFYSLLVAPALISSKAVAHVVLGALISLFGVPVAPIASGAFAPLFAAALLMLASDAGFFIAHYLNHRVPLLWAFHKVHHSAEVLTPFTAFRSHPVNLAFDFEMGAITSGATSALLAYSFDTDLTATTLLGVNAFTFALQIAGANLRHSHIALDYGPSLSRILISPAMHQIHHSAAPQHRNKNLGGILSIWDRCAGTLYLPRSGEQFCAGLGDASPPFESIEDLYAQPFRDLVRTAVRLQTKSEK